MKTAFFTLLSKNYSSWCLTHDLPTYTLCQVLEWITKKSVVDIQLMTNISKTNRNKLTTLLTIDPFLSTQKHKASDGLATKYMFEIEPHVFIEAVAIQEKNYETLCISSQAGCPVDCKFCLTGVNGLKRNLTYSEIIAQLAIIRSFGHAITHVVFMGMGEPLLNLNNVLPAIDWFEADNKFNISKRHITVSTAGYIPGIQRLIKENRPLNLAFSVGSAIPDVRESIMPIEKRHPIIQTSQVLNEYGRFHNRQLTLEYTLLKTVNDSRDQALQLANLAKFLRAKVNLINLNPHDKIPFSPVSNKHLNQFKHWLLAQKIQTTVRYSKGQDIIAACGQLGESNAGPKPSSYSHGLKKHHTDR